MYTVTLDGAIIGQFPARWHADLFIAAMKDQARKRGYDVESFSANLVLVHPV